MGTQQETRGPRRIMTQKLYIDLRPNSVGFHEMMQALELALNVGEGQAEICCCYSFPISIVNLCRRGALDWGLVCIFPLHRLSLLTIRGWRTLFGSVCLAVFDFMAELFCKCWMTHTSHSRYVDFVVTWAGLPSFWSPKACLFCCCISLLLSFHSHSYRYMEIFMSRCIRTCPFHIQKFLKTPDQVKGAQCLRGDVTLRNLAFS